MHRVGRQVRHIQSYLQFKVEQNRKIKAFIRQTHKMKRENEPTVKNKIHNKINCVKNKLGCVPTISRYLVIKQGTLGEVGISTKKRKNPVLYIYQQRYDMKSIDTPTNFLIDTSQRQ